MSKKILLLISSVFLYLLIRLVHLFRVTPEDYKSFVINIITEIVGIIIVTFIVDYFLSLERKFKWSNINKESSKSIKQKIQQNILSTLNQFTFIDFHTSTVHDLPRMKNLMKDFLNNHYDKIISEKLNDLNQQNREFIMHLAAWLTNCNDEIIRTLNGIRPNPDPKIIEKIKMFKSYTWFVHRSLQRDGKMALPDLNSGIIPEEAIRRQPDLKIGDTDNYDPNSFKEKVAEILRYMITLHDLAEKNKLFYFVE